MTQQQIDNCEYIFLAAKDEPEPNALRIVVEEGKSKSGAETVKTPAGGIPNLHAIEVTEDSKIFELTWGTYMIYAVTNESVIPWESEEVYEGKLFRVYSKSNFLDYMKKATVAQEEYPGKLTHYQLVCCDHIVDIISNEAPKIKVV